MLCITPRRWSSLTPTQKPVIDYYYYLQFKPFSDVSILAHDIRLKRGPKHNGRIDAEHDCVTVYNRVVDIIHLSFGFECQPVCADNVLLDES